MMNQISGVPPGPILKRIGSHLIAKPQVNRFTTKMDYIADETDLTAPPRTAKEFDESYFAVFLLGRSGFSMEP